MAIMRIFRLLPAALLLAAGLVMPRPAAAQWEIFAERPPAPGAWAKFDLTRKRVADGYTDHTEVTIAVTGAEVRAGKNFVWLEIFPTKWLGSKQKGALKFLIPADMSREQASHLMQNASEIIFQEPGRTPYYMTPADVARNAHRVGLEQSSQVTPAGNETITTALGRFQCEKGTLSGRMVIDPPFVSKRTTTMAGSIWFRDEIPFRVVRVFWKETDSKGKESEVEEKTLTLVAHGMTGAKTRAPNRGDAFSLWRLLKR